MKSTIHIDPSVHARSWSMLLVAALRSGAATVAIAPSPSVAARRRDARYSGPASTQLAKRDVRRKREDDHAARDSGDALHKGRQPAVKHRAREREQLLPGERRENGPRDERGPRGKVGGHFRQRDGERDEIDDGGRVQQREREKDQVHRSADLTVYYARGPEHAADGDVGEHDRRNDPRRRKKWFKEAARRRTEQHRQRGVDQVRGRRTRAGGSGGSESLRDSDPQDQDRDRTDRDRDGVAGRDADEEGPQH